MPTEQTRTRGPSHGKANADVLLSGVAMAILASAAVAWHAGGHRRATALAANALPDALPDFFRNGTDLLTHCACDPDTFRRPFAQDELHEAAAPEHYFDLEPLNGGDIPRKRHDFLAWCFANDIPPAAVGLAPYAITEWTQRLTVAFAEHRRWPNDPNIQTKCLVYAGLLAHYAQDLCQPLHTTMMPRDVPGLTCSTLSWPQRAQVREGRVPAQGRSQRTNKTDVAAPMQGVAEVMAPGGPMTAAKELPSGDDAATRVMRQCTPWTSS